MGKFKALCFVSVSLYAVQQLNNAVICIGGRHFDTHNISFKCHSILFIQYLNLRMYILILNFIVRHHQQNMSPKIKC